LKSRGAHSHSILNPGNIKGYLIDCLFPAPNPFLFSMLYLTDRQMEEEGALLYAKMVNLEPE
jgi:hypothetical protein